MKDFKTIFFFMRLPIALSFLGHGLVRLPKLGAFSDYVLKTMEKSVIPDVISLPFAYILPFLETLIGLSLLIGFKIKYTLFAGLSLMGILILGSASVEDWPAIGAQLLHSIYLFGILWFLMSSESKIVN